jgi:hypothetical protein
MIGLMKPRTVIFYGQSMLLSLVASSLANNENLCVVEAAEWEQVKALTDENFADVLIYDCESAFNNQILPLLFTNPRILLIGLDVENNRAVLLSGKESSSLTMEQVRDIVLTH